MKKRIILILLGVCMMMTMASCKPGERKKPTKDKTYEILFIGNNHATRVFSKKFTEYEQAEIYSTINVENVNFVDN